MSDLFPESTTDGVYIGFWINRSFGPVQGATLTLKRRDGSLLIAFLALFVSSTGRALWKFTRLSVHLWLSSSNESNAVYHQAQAILRNSNLAYEAAHSFMKASFVWRYHPHHGVNRLLLLGLTAGMTSIGFIAAGRESPPYERWKMSN
jgi:hypothetical protein